MSLGDRIRVPAGTAPPQRAPRGRVWLYAIAFVLLLVAGWLQVKGNLNSNLEQVRWAIALSIGAAVVAVASVLVPGRRVGTKDDATPGPSTATTGNGSAGSVSKSDPEPSSPGRERPDDEQEAAASADPDEAEPPDEPPPSED